MPLQDNDCRLAFEPAAHGEGVVLYGDWTAANLSHPAVWAAVHAGLRRAQITSQPVWWDLRQLRRLDHTGAQVLWNAWSQSWPDHLQVLDAQAVILQRIARLTVATQAPPERTLRTFYFQLGAWVGGVGDHLAAVVRLIGQLMLDLIRLVRHPATGPWRDISGHLYRIGATALPITALVGFLIGVVLAYLMSHQLRQFGADAFIVNILGMSLIRELGPVLAAILIAGRSGSAITAQIGVMRVTEELAAMQVMGIAPGYRLVMPRALAMSVAMPLLAAWTTAAALLGGMLAADVAMGMTPAYFVSALPKVVQLSNLWIALGKSTLFGLLIALIGCHFGLRVQPDTQSLGEGTTASVVASITAVLLVDAMFAVVFKGVGT